MRERERGWLALALNAASSGCCLLCSLCEPISPRPSRVLPSYPFTFTPLSLEFVLNLEHTVHFFFFFFPVFLFLLVAVVRDRSMDDGKRAAKAFVNQYFPVREPNSKAAPADVLGDLFPPNRNSNKRESPDKKQGGYYGGPSIFAQSTAAAGGKYNGSPHAKGNKGGNSSEYCEISEPCLMSSSVDYGCRDNYPYNPDNRYPGPSYTTERKDAKDGSNYSNSEISGPEWWQGSYYY